VLCGTIEQHIVADVAYGTWQYWLATQDREFMSGPGAELMIECARFWASRAEPDSGGKFHIRRVIGPDEYHENVDNNAFTNYMAAWTLRRTADAVELQDRLIVSAAEITEWLAIADGLVFLADPANGLIEQFEGYHSLIELEFKGSSMLPTPLDVLAGHERIQTTQLIKQPDVVMLMALHPDAFAADVVEKNFRYYEPRSNHGSSLSPPIHALTAARLNDFDVAASYLTRCAEIDLNSRTGNSRDGVHGATLGGLWQALAFGFAGLRLTEHGLRINPTVDPSWERFCISFEFRQNHFTLSVGGRGRSFSLTCSGSAQTPVAIGGGDYQALSPGVAYEFTYTGHEWQAKAAANPSEAE
jgi:trehalose/maltose hydrolase-like predicted phosphorylase